ncbi:MAG: ATP-binding protein [Dissulfuribacterales bacterium]
MTRKKLPIGIQTFSKIREENYYYVDKTPLIERLVNGGTHYFLSRPRRFGKSLFLDTLAEAFSGNKSLFEGLYLERNWDWNKKYPVIRISFAEGRLFDAAGLNNHIHVELDANASRLGSILPGRSEDVHVRFRALIETAAQKYNQRAVVLVDEYDKPILDNLTEPEIARSMREGLCNFYSVLKGQDANLKFVFLTGVSKFSKVSIFSGLNNLMDITLLSEYATICGYTDNDINTVFAPELEGLDRDEIRRWYNGYSWLGERVYNPFDVLLLFNAREFRSWWFETGTPTFLVNWLKERNFFTPSLEHTFADDELLSAFDVDYIRPEAMLWQTGYLTIGERQRRGAKYIYWLRCPNCEVRSALNDVLVKAWMPDAGEVARAGAELYEIIAGRDIDGMRRHFERLFASIPHDWYRNNSIAQYEGYYASVFYSHLAALGLDIIAEDVSNHGQCDLAVRFENRIYLFEFKVIDGEEPTGEALQQLLSRDYAAKYRDDKTEIVQIGIEFSQSKRQVVEWRVAT